MHALVWGEKCAAARTHIVAVPLVLAAFVFVRSAAPCVSGGAGVLTWSQTRMGNVSTVPPPHHDVIETTERFMNEEVHRAGAAKPEAPRDPGEVAEEAETQRTQKVEKRVAQLKAESGVLQAARQTRCDAEAKQLLECYRQKEGSVCANYVQLYAHCAAGKNRA